jgi:succinate-acetate transporter protein
MQIAVLILFATREIGLSADAIGVAYAFGGLSCVLASMSAQRLSARFGIGPVNVHGLILSTLGPGLRADRQTAVATTSNRVARYPARYLRQHP